MRRDGSVGGWRRKKDFVEGFGRFSPVSRRRLRSGGGSEASCVGSSARSSGVFISGEKRDAVSITPPRTCLFPCPRVCSPPSGTRADEDRRCQPDRRIAQERDAADEAHRGLQPEVGQGRLT